MEPVLDPDITLTSESEEETYEPAEDNRMEIALMSRPTEFKAGLPEDFSGKNDDATQWLLAMKAYFVINEKVYTKETKEQSTLGTESASFAIRRDLTCPSTEGTPEREGKEELRETIPGERLWRL